MRVKRAGFEFWVELSADKEGVNAFRQFSDFHKAFIAGLAGKNNPFFFQFLDKIRIDFVAMAVSFGNFFFL